MESEHSNHNIVLEDYEAIAEAYAKTVDTKPWHIYFERPATLSLLPNIKGLNVLDAGCGSGWYAEWFLNHGANVTAIDLSPKMVELTRKRVQDRAIVRLADLNQGLPFIQKSSLDLIVAPFVVHYIEDWAKLFREFARMLRPNGHIVFSTHHPHVDAKLFEIDDYYATVLLEDEWHGIGKMHFYHHSLAELFRCLANAGFVTEQLLEARPTPEFKQALPEEYERLMKNPWYLHIKACKKY